MLGHPGYYPRLGYRPMREFGLAVTPVREANCMALPLVADGLKGAAGSVAFAPEFWEGTPPLRS